MMGETKTQATIEPSFAPEPGPASTVAAPIPAPIPAAFGPGRPDMGMRCQAWLRERNGMAFDRVEPSPSDVLVRGGACRAWSYRSKQWDWWAYAGCCGLLVAGLAAAVAGRGVGPAVSSPAGIVAWAALLASVLAWGIAHRQRVRDRRVVAVAWDQGDRPLKPTERASIASALRTRWPDAQESWLITLRPLGVPENDQGLIVFPIRGADLPPVSAERARSRPSE